MIPTPSEVAVFAETVEARLQELIAGEVDAEEEQGVTAADAQRVVVEGLVSA